jgi:hypothetical protein
MENQSTKVITGKVRFSYLHVFEPKAVSEGGEKKYSVSLIIPKDDKATVGKIKKAIDTALQAGIGKFGGKVPGEWKNPLRDGDLARPDDEAYANSYFINANCKTKPGVVNALKKPITDEEELYSGCYGYASVNFYAFNTNGNKGVACGLNNLMKVANGEFLGGRASADTDFADVEVPFEAPSEADDLF